MKISKLEVSKHIKGRILVTLEDGSLLKCTEQEVLDFTLQVGKELDVTTIEALQKSAKSSETRVTAAQMVGKRPCSVKELRTKLQQKGYEEADIEETIEWLQNIGAIDEESYGKMLVRHYSSMGYGPQKWKEEFYHRGVPKELWNSLIEEAPQQEDVIEKIVEQKTKGKPVTEKERKKLCDALVRRGFSWEKIHPILDQLTIVKEEENT